jgi:hypothetical protein
MPQANLNCFWTPSNPNLQPSSAGISTRVWEPKYPTSTMNTHRETLWIRAYANVPHGYCNFAKLTNITYLTVLNTQLRSRAIPAEATRPSTIYYVHNQPTTYTRKIPTHTNYRTMILYTHTYLLPPRPPHLHLPHPPPPSPKPTSYPLTLQLPLLLHPHLPTTRLHLKTQMRLN